MNNQIKKIFKIFFIIFLLIFSFVFTFSFSYKIKNYNTTERYKFLYYLTFDGIDNCNSLKKIQDKGYYLIFDLALKGFGNNCINKLNKKKIIYVLLDKKGYKFANVNDFIKFKRFKKELRKKGIILVLPKNSDLSNNLFLAYIFNLFSKYNFFNGIENGKRIFLLTKKEFKIYKNFEKYFYKNLDLFINIRKRFFDRYNIKQNVYNLFSEDAYSCNSYTLTEFLIYMNYILDIVENFNNKVIIDKKNLLKYSKVKFYKNLYEKINNYRIEMNKQKGYKGRIDDDVNNFLNTFIYFIKKGDIYNKVIIDKNYNFYNPLLNFLIIKTGPRTYHSGLQICGKNECKQYRPETGYEKDKSYHKFYFIKRKIEFDSNYTFVLVK